MKKVRFAISTTFSKKKDVIEDLKDCKEFEFSNMSSNRTKSGDYKVYFTVKGEIEATKAEKYLVNKNLSYDKNWMK